MVQFKIVIGESDSEMRSMMEETLQEAFEVAMCSSGKEVLEKTEEVNPDLVMVDYQIEDISAIQIQQEINKKFPHVAVVMISNIDRSKISLESMRRRAMDYIYRSTDPNRLLNDVCKLVRYILETRSHREEKSVLSSSYYDLAKKLHAEKKWTVEDIQKALEKLEAEKR